MIAAARMKGMREAKDRSDGIYFMDRRGDLLRLADYPDSARNDSIRSLNVNDDGDMVIYEQTDTVVRYSKGVDGRFTLTERHPGRLPVLLPTSGAYLYADHGQIVRGNGGSKTDLLPAPKVGSLLRVSPDGKWVFFDTEIVDNYLRWQMCNLESRACFDGPGVIDGRTFWIKR
jgi:hypothetical protein